MIIDLHAHYVPRRFLEAIEKHGAPHGASLRQDGADPTIVVGGRPYGPITRHYYETKPRLADMDKARVDMQVLSLNPPMVYWADAELGTRLARLYNDDLAATVAERPDRLGGLATVPLQDIPAAVLELERAVRQLGLKGVYIGSRGFKCVWPTPAAPCRTFSAAWTASTAFGRKHGGRSAARPACTCADSPTIRSPTPSRRFDT